MNTLVPIGGLTLIVILAAVALWNIAMKRTLHAAVLLLRDKREALRIEMEGMTGDLLIAHYEQERLHDYALEADDKLLFALARVERHEERSADLKSHLTQLMAAPPADTERLTRERDEARDRYAVLLAQMPIALVSSIATPAPVAPGTDGDEVDEAAAEPEQQYAVKRKRGVKDKPTATTDTPPSA